MRLSAPSLLRRIIASSYHPFQIVPKPDRWLPREQLNRFAAWQYASERDTVKGAKRKQEKLFHYLNMQRLDERNLEKFHAQRRLEAALQEHCFEYKHFRNMMDKAHILLDNIVLSQLAIYEPRTFQSLVSLAKKMAIADGRPITADDENSVNVHLDRSLFGEPIPKAASFPKGASEDHTQKPRKLRSSEF